jgi:hypothetical protein
MVASFRDDSVEELVLAAVYSVDICVDQTIESTKEKS